MIYVMTIGAIFLLSVLCLVIILRMVRHAVFGYELAQFKKSNYTVDASLHYSQSEFLVEMTSNNRYLAWKTNNLGDQIGWVYHYDLRANGLSWILMPAYSPNNSIKKQLVQLAVPAIDAEKTQMVLDKMRS